MATILYIRIHLLQTLFKIRLNGDTLNDIYVYIILKIIILSEIGKKMFWLTCELKTYEFIIIIIDW